MNPDHNGGGGGGAWVGGGGGGWAGGGSSSNGGESRRGSNTESRESRKGSNADESWYSDTDASESSPRPGQKFVASALAEAADNEDAGEAAEYSNDVLGWGGDFSTGGEVFGGEVGAGAGGPIMEGKKALLRSTVLAGVDEGMDCIDEEDPEQLDA